jgi:hypothetical protein
MYVKAAGKMLLYYAPEADLRQWSELPLTGFPSSADIQQINVFEQVLYVVAGNVLYRSADGLSWEAAAGAPPVIALLGSVAEGRNTPSLLSAIVDSEGLPVFAAMNKEGVWTQGKAVPYNFPVSGFGSVGHSRMSSEYLTIVAGKAGNGVLLNTTWTTTNATEWIVLTRDSVNYFDGKEGVTLAIYDDKFYLTGGFNAGGNASKDVYLSRDNGLSWLQTDTMVAFPASFTARGYAGVAVNADNYMFVFGGKTSKSGKHLDEIWRGRINRLGFGKKN